MQKKNLNIEKIVFKVVQSIFLALHIINQKLSLDIFTVGHSRTPYNVFLAIATNIPQRLTVRLLLCSRVTYVNQSLE